MKMDLHCHTREGSLDGIASIASYVGRLMELGYDGMLVTDHNSYKGYEHWLKIKDDIIRDMPEARRFTVLRGIEYDTYNSGHMLIVLPENVTSTVLLARGLSATKLIKVVHELGGIIGPAHPYGTGYYAIMNTRLGRKHVEVMADFDFVETFNGKTSKLGNDLAALLAKRYDKPAWAGSDSHRVKDIGKVYALFDGEIRNNDDLIEYVRSGKCVEVGGQHNFKLHSLRNRIVEKCGIAGYWVYNKWGAFYRFPARKRARRTYLSNRAMNGDVDERVHQI
jgi:hypothetical protein